jgi:hypothetical protein
MNNHSFILPKFPPPFEKLELVSCLCQNVNTANHPMTILDGLVIYKNILNSICYGHKALPLGGHLQGGIDLAVILVKKRKKGKRGKNK